MPVEFLLALWFLGVAGSRARLASAGRLLLWSGIVILAVCAGLSYETGIRCVPILLATLVALAVVTEAAMRLSRSRSSLSLVETARQDLQAVRRPEFLVRLVIVAATVVVAAQYFALTAGATTAVDRDAQLVRWYESEPRITSTGLVAPNKIRLVVFTDYQCPACSFQVPTLEGIVSRYHKAGYGDVELVSRDFPLNADCNPGIVTRIHPLACRAAVAARVATKVLAAAESLEFRNRLYSRHGALTDADLERYLKDAGLLASFNESFDEELAKVRQDAQDGKSLGINGTPTIFLDGRAIRDAQPKAIAAILSHLHLEEAKVPQ